MKYFLDTEFIEGPQKERFPISLFRKKTPNTIDLISIGIVAEDGREYYAISKDFNLREAWNRFDLKTITLGSGKVVPDKKVYWLRENVLRPIFMEITTKYNLDGMDFTYKNLKGLITIKGKTNKEIAKEIKSFCDSEYHCIKARRSNCSESDQSPFLKKPEFYAYYADYDWVVFCWLFGKMIDLPQGFPTYCKDLKQMLDEKAKIQKEVYNPEIKKHYNFPKQDPSKSHNAIEDARWNKQLYDFLNKL